MRNCSIQSILDQYLKDNKVINKEGVITDVLKFREQNRALTAHAIDKYGLEPHGKTLYEIKEVPQDNGSILYEVSVNESLMDSLNHIVDDHMFMREYSEPLPKDMIDPDKKIENLVKEGSENKLTVADEVRDADKSTNYNKELLFNSSEGKTFNADAVLSNAILNNKESVPSAESKNIMDSTEKMLRKNKTKVEIVSDSRLIDSENLMEYDQSSNKILIPESTINELSADEITLALMHESLNSIMLNTMKDPLSTDQKIFQSFVNDYFEWYSNREGSDLSSITNASDFLAKITNDANFRSELVDANGPGLNNWDSFKKSVRSLLDTRRTKSHLKYLNSILDSGDYTSINQYLESSESILKTVEEKQRSEGYYDLTTLAGKMEKKMDQLYDNVSHQLYKYDKMLKNPEALKKETQVRDYQETFKKLLEDINKSTEGKTLTGAINYIEFVNSQMNSLMERTSNQDLNSPDLKKELSLYKNYASSYSIVSELKKFFNDIHKDVTQDLISKEDLVDIRTKINQIESNYSSVSTDLNNMRKEVVFQLLNKERYRTDVAKEMESEYLSQFPRKERKSRQAEFIRLLNGELQNEFNERMEKRTREIIENVLHDSSALSANFLNQDDISHPLIQALSNMLETTNDTMIDLTHTLEIDMANEFARIVKEKGTGNIKKLYEHSFEKDSKGRSYLKGDYSIEFYHKFKDEMNLNEKLSDAWLKEHTQLNVDANGNQVRVPSDKYKTDFESLSQIDKDIILYARDKFRKASDDTYGISSIVRHSLNNEFFFLPAVTKSRLERMLSGELKQLGGDALRDASRVRVDDVGYEKVRVDASNQLVMETKIHYRGQVNASEQSLDLFNLVALEARNGINFKVKSSMENDASILTDLARDKDFFKMTSGKIMSSYTGRRSPLIEIPGQESRVYKKMTGMMETYIYDILSKHMGSISGLDANKVLGTVMSHGAILGMGINTLAASVNVTNSKAQLLLESIGGHHINIKSIAKSEAMYFKDMPDNIKDISNPMKTSFTNQFGKMFDVWGSVNARQTQAFIKNNFVKIAMNTDSLMFMQNLGEHWVTNVIGMSVADGVKVMNKDSQLIDKNGKVVKDQKDAASLLDMLSKDKTGKLVMDSKVVYTTHTKNVKYGEGGKELINRFVKKKLRDTVGNYDPKGQPELAKHVMFKMVQMFRKYLTSFILARYRGIDKVHKRTSELETKDQLWSEALQENEFGSYTTFARYMWQAGKALVQQQSIEAVKLEFNRASDFEISQFRKSTAELIFAMMILPLATAAAKAMMSDDSEENRMGWFLIANLRRLDSELSAFYNPGEQWKITKSPAAGITLMEDYFRLFSRVINPFAWGEKFEGGKNAGRYKISRDAEKMIPVWKSKNVSFKDKYNYIHNQATY